MAWIWSVEWEGDGRRPALFLRTRQLLLLAPPFGLAAACWPHVPNSAATAGAPFLVSAEAGGKQGASGKQSFYLEELERYRKMACDSKGGDRALVK